jgi:Fur family transcriptional regulator, zinc uptake regulator
MRDEPTLLTTPPYNEFALAVLRERGLRITEPRRRVVGLLAQGTRPLSAYDMKALLDAEGTPVDVVSIYRVLDCLEQHHLIHRVGSTGKVVGCQPGQARCGHGHPSNHHWHVLLVCVGCGQVSETEAPPMLDTLTQHLLTHQHFKAQLGPLEVKGRCAACSH